MLSDFTIFQNKYLNGDLHQKRARKYILLEKLLDLSEITRFF